MENDYISEDYIRREAVLIKVWKADLDKEDEEWLNEQIKSIPAADVRPVVRGEWISCTEESADGTKYVGHICSMCNEWEGFAEDCNFCPNCGADMRPEPGKEAQMKGEMNEQD